MPPKVDQLAEMYATAFPGTVASSASSSGGGLLRQEAKDDLGNQLRQCNDALKQRTLNQREAEKVMNHYKQQSELYKATLQNAGIPIPLVRTSQQQQPSSSRGNPYARPSYAQRRPLPPGAVLAPAYAQPSAGYSPVLMPSTIYDAPLSPDYSTYPDTGYAPTVARATSPSAAVARASLALSTLATLAPSTAAELYTPSSPPGAPPAIEPDYSQVARESGADQYDDYDQYYDEPDRRLTWLPMRF
jgi:hypothetical protein